MLNGLNTQSAGIHRTPLWSARNGSTSNVLFLKLRYASKARDVKRRFKVWTRGPYPAANPTIPVFAQQWV